MIYGGAVLVVVALAMIYQGSLRLGGFGVLALGILMCYPVS